MKLSFYTDNARPCWNCSGTVAEYTTDDTVSLIDVRCIGCGRHDVFRPIADRPLDTAAEISAAHRV